MNEENDSNTDTLRCAVRLRRRNRAGLRDADNDFIIRDIIGGESNSNDQSDNNTNLGGDNYNNEREHNAHSANVSNGENESGNYTREQERARVGATGACQGDHGGDNDYSTDNGTAEEKHNSKADNNHDNEADYNYKDDYHNNGKDHSP